jgi:hypothetical protein
VCVCVCVFACVRVFVRACVALTELTCAGHYHEQELGRVGVKCFQQVQMDQPFPVARPQWRPPPELEPPNYPFGVAATQNFLESVRLHHACTNARHLADHKGCVSANLRTLQPPNPSTHQKKPHTHKLCDCVLCEV